MTAERILSAVPRLSTLVVGDICLDRWCTYDPALSEPSRETGIPRLAVVATEVTPGAGGTVANNLAALGAGRVAVLGAVGDDGHAYELLRALAARGIDSSALVHCAGLATFTYTKLINSQTGREDQPRVDFVNPRPLPPEAEQAILERLPVLVEKADAVLISDQAETEEGGVITPRVRELLAELAQRRTGKVFWVDSRKRIAEFRHMILKPNQEEAEEACRRLGLAGYEALRRHASAPFVVVTHGPRGVLIVDSNGETWAKTRPVDNPVDICGAGDSFSAGAAMALAAGASPLEAARFGNLVASVTIMKRGTGTASPEEVLAAESGAVL
ncbi:MAG: ribokinase [Bryobacteraceae bacterium]|nr:ribokinase [Bryobacteraceae bacterium]